jgi:hypothetical protein
LKHVEFFSAAEVTIAKQALPIGRHYRDGLREK